MPRTPIAPPLANDITAILYGIAIGSWIAAFATGTIEIRINAPGERSPNGSPCMEQIVRRSCA